MGVRAVHWAAETTAVAMGKKWGAGSILFPNDEEFASEITRINYKFCKLARYFACHQYVFLDLSLTLQSRGDGSNFYLSFWKWRIILTCGYPKNTCPVI